MAAKQQAAAVTPVRCAIYTRKSTEEGLDQAFNSLDAQREAGEAYIKSQLHEGWVLVPERYDDGGFTGGNMDRPALKRLLLAIDEGGIDAVVVYKVDRLSRSLLDFGRMMEVFDARGVSFVSVTQQLNTATSMGRLVLNVLLSFAQFEREIISERTRDKIAATRRKGKWTGGRPVLGYRVDPTLRKLVVVPDEAERVREIFRLYLEEGSLAPVVKELNQLGWRNRSGAMFTRATLHHLLTNVLYTGRVRYHDEVHDGEHEDILDGESWQRAQTFLVRNGRTGTSPRGKSDALLAGLLRCAACDRAMTPTHTGKPGRKYRYYICTAANHRGRSACPTKSVPAGGMEAVVLDQMRKLIANPEVVRQVLDRAEKLHRRGRGPKWDRAGARAAIESFDPVWSTLTTAEQSRFLSLLIDRIDFDRLNGTVRLTLHSGGIAELPNTSTPERA